ncbi:unnamed protein product [Caenorhabditis brenneri]
MFSSFESASDYPTKNGEPTNFDSPPYYIDENNYDQPVVEVCQSPPNSDFEPIEKQRHFGILRYTVLNRFKWLTLIGLVIIALSIAILLTLILDNRNSGNTSTEKTTRTTIKPTTTDKKIQQEDVCGPISDTTLLFGYSNDFEQITVQNVLNAFTYYQMISRHYTHFGAVRFDMRDHEEFYFHGNWSYVGNHINDHLPESSLGFKNFKSGSDVLEMIDRFISNDEVPVCGARVFIMVKRYPNENQYSDLVNKLKEYHVILTLLVSTSQSGGQHPETLYDLASRTNGVCGFDSDEKMGEALTYLETVSYPYLVYAVNPFVSQNGRIQLKSLIVPDETFYSIAMTIQNYDPVKYINNVTLSWSFNSEVVGSVGSTCSPESGNHMSSVQKFKREPYNMTLDYAYSVAGTKRLQIRVYGSDYSALDQWQPYDD